MILRLELDPYTSPGALPSKDARVPNGFTASFDDGLFTYQVKVDMPVIEPLDLLWL